jgi:hypothetical protein
MLLSSAKSVSTPTWLASGQLLTLPGSKRKVASGQLGTACGLPASPGGNSATVSSSRPLGKGCPAGVTIVLSRKSVEAASG